MGPHKGLVQGPWCFARPHPSSHPCPIRNRPGGMVIGSNCRCLHSTDNTHTAWPPTGLRHDLAAYSFLFLLLVTANTEVWLEPHPVNPTMGLPPPPPPTPVTLSCCHIACTLCLCMCPPPGSTPLSRRGILRHFDAALVWPWCGPAVARVQPWCGPGAARPALVTCGSECRWFLIGTCVTLVCTRATGDGEFLAGLLPGDQT